MKYQLKYTKKALQNLEGLEKKVAKRILQKLDFFVTQENPLEFAKKWKKKWIRDGKEISV